MLGQMSHCYWELPCAFWIPGLYSSEANSLKAIPPGVITRSIFRHFQMSHTVGIGGNWLPVENHLTIVISLSNVKNNFLTAQTQLTTSQSTQLLCSLWTLLLLEALLLDVLHNSYLPLMDPYSPLVAFLPSLQHLKLWIFLLLSI